MACGSWSPLDHFLFLLEGSFREERIARAASDRRVNELRQNIDRRSGPKILLRYDNERPAGIAAVLNSVLYENFGGRSAHNVRLIPDKAKEFWLEQVGFVDVVAPGNRRRFGVRAMMRDGDREEKIIDSDRDPLRILAATMAVEGVEREIPVTVAYQEFDDDEKLTTRFVFRLDNLQEPHFVLITRDS
jgi:hypothetical protein